MTNETQRHRSYWMQLEERGCPICHGPIGTGRLVIVPSQPCQHCCAKAELLTVTQVAQWLFHPAVPRVKEMLWDELRVYRW
jgi:hypothetical protein